MIALSGGVDSAVAAGLLLKQGYEVIAGHIKINSVDEKCAQQDVVDARRIAAKLGIPFYVFDFDEEYHRRVVDYFVQTYAMGKTPNPDVLCNKEIKFGILLEKAKSLGVDFIATGHYVRRDKQKLLRGIDKNKDQSYFLWQLSKEQLSQSIFPIGDLQKGEVRDLAEKLKLEVAKKKDSQGICFLGHVSIKDFLSKFLDIKQGKITLPTGEEVGRHDGAVFYTIGQRHGFNLASSQAGIKSNEPLFVVAKDVVNNILVVAPGRDNPLLFKKTIWLEEVNFINPLPSNSIEVDVQIRYRQTPQKASFKFLKLDNIWQLDFKNPVWAPAIGQHAVFYNGDELLGGGVIKEVK